jgi:uncharacterized protein
MTSGKDCVNVGSCSGCSLIGPELVMLSLQAYLLYLEGKHVGSGGLFMGNQRLGATGLTAAIVAAGVMLAGEVNAQAATFPAPPPPGTYHVDEGRLLRSAETAEIDRIASELLQDRDVALVVVTLPSLASRQAAGYTIERYAAELFDRWGIGSPRSNYGILLLVSAGDRIARIELGAAYAGRYDGETAKVMNGLILPEFRAGRYTEGILAGVRGLDAMARGLPIPSAPMPWYVLPILAGIFAGGGALAYSLHHSGRRGWAWALLAALAALLLLLLSLLGRAGASGGGGGSGGRGGAFGGGSSGGGGATGRW